jgi:prophage regulatory protein
MSEVRNPIHILRLPSVTARTGLSRSSIYGKVADGSFPRPLVLGGGRAVGWIESQVDDWLQNLTVKS